MHIIRDRAVNFSLLNKAWQAAAGIVTIPLVVHFLGPVLQGYYYTFASLVALQSFFELGLSIVISVHASHEWHKLRLDSKGGVEGDGDALSRLVSLGRFMFRYYGLASLAYLAIAGGVGVHVLGREQGAAVVWLAPWLLHVSLSALSLWLTPYLSLLEGCNQIAAVAKFRLLQSLAMNAALWTALAAGLKLWALPFSMAVSITLLAMHLGWRKRRFFADFFRPPAGAHLSWKNDLLPMQWRLAVQGLFGYLSFPLFTVLAYSYMGPVEAGRVGMTLQVMTGIQSFSLVFLLARAPQFAMLAAAGKRSELVALGLSATGRSMGVMAFFSLVAVLVVWGAGAAGIDQASRVLSPTACAIFSVGVVLTAPVQGVALYLRAHKRELMTAVGATTGILYGLVGWFASARAGALGIAIGYALVTGLVTLPLTLLVLKTNYRRLQALY